MTRHLPSVPGVIGLALLLLVVGCGEKKNPQGQLENPAKAKVEAFGRVADEVAKDPNSTAVAGALEEYTIIPFDAQNSPKEGEEIVQIYRQRIEGKGGKYAQEIKTAIAAVRAGLTRAKK